MRCPTLAVPMIGLLLFFLAALAPAQPVDDGFGEVIDVELVNVDVWVTDDDGSPVRGLTAADFRVEHDGEEVEITHFVEQTGGAGSVAIDPRSTTTAATEDDPDPATAAAQEPAIVVYFDQLRTHPVHVQTVVQHLEKLLDSTELASEQILVLRQDQGLHIEVPFGSSRREVSKALNLLEESVGGAELETQTAQALRQLDDLWRVAEQRQASADTGASNIPSAPTLSGGGSVMDRFRGSGGRGGPENGACTDFMTQVEPFVREWAQIEGQRTRTTLWHLGRVGNYLAGLPGVKSLLYVSDGLDLQPGGHLAAYVGGLCPGADSELRGDLSSASLQRDFESLTRDLNARRVTLHAVQAGGLESSKLQQASQGGLAGRNESRRGRSAFETRLRSGEREGLKLLAGETGGRVLVRRNDLSREMLELASDLRPHYSLAYPLPPEEERDGGKIRVRLADADHDLRFRRGWARIDGDRMLADRLDGALFLGLVENPLGVRLSVAEILPTPEGLLSLPLRVLVPAEALVPVRPAIGDDPAVAAVKLRVLARHLETQEVVAKETRFRVRLPEDPEGELSVLPIDLELPVGSFTLAVGARDEASRQTSVVTTQLDL